MSSSGETPHFRYSTLGPIPTSVMKRAVEHGATSFPGGTSRHPAGRFLEPLGTQSRVY